MDMGVGSFVVTNALLGSQRQPPSSAAARVPYVEHLVKSVRGICPLLLLGIARVAAVKGVNYQEHASEYGVHWNFFFSLAAVALATSVCKPANDAPLLFGGLLLLVHEFLLTLLGVGEWALQESPDGNRRGESLLEQNREGIVSIPGYWALHLLSTALARFLRIGRWSQHSRAKWRGIEQSAFVTGVGGSLVAVCLW
eukprot:scaffold879_cov410-Prasinococcus_capsulatus_cf.AAC.21